MGRVCMGRVCYGPSLSWAEFVMGRVVQLPIQTILWEQTVVVYQYYMQAEQEQRSMTNCLEIYAFNCHKKNK